MCEHAYPREKVGMQRNLAPRPVLTFPVTTSACIHIHIMLHEMN